MKKINYRIIVLILTTLYFSSCRKNSNNDDITVFTGKIENNATGEVRIESNDTVYKSSVGDDGSFKMRFSLGEENVFTYVGNELTTIHLLPGDSLFMSVDAETWRKFDKTLTFSGKGSEKNNYFFHKSLVIDKLFDSELNKLFSMDENKFLTYLDSACAVLDGNYKVYIKENPQISYKRLKLEDESIEYFKKDIIMQYYLSDQKNNNSERIATIIDKIISDIDLNNLDHSILDSYNRLVIDYFRYQLHINSFADDNKALIFALKNINSSIEKDEIKTPTMQYFIKQGIAAGNINESILTNMKLQLNSDEFTRFKSIFEEEKPLAINDNAPDFKLYDKEGHEYSLSRFSENYIYIDVWASYCGPCLKEAPYFEQLKKDFEDKNISFISISLDRKESDWLNTVDNYNMSKYQLRPANDWSSDFVDDYSINHYGIPHYIIIDPKGCIMQMPAKKPSEIGVYLNQVLK